MKKLISLLRNARGASAVEFALVAPAFILIIVGLAQVGIVFFANAGLHNALAEGARSATVYPRPTPAEVEEKINANRFGLNPDNLTINDFEYLESGGNTYTDIEMRYTLSLNFIVVEQPITLKQTRRVYLQPLPEV